MPWAGKVVLRDLGDQPLVSIVTPCLNPGQRLGACLESVRRQRYPRVEHIVIDGGSTDRTVDLLEHAEGIQWISEQDEGQASAINKGFKMAKGEVLSWLNADDTLQPSAVQIALDAMISTGAAVVYGNLEIVEKGISRTWVPHDDPGRHLFDMGKGGVIPQPGSIFAAEALANIGWIDESFQLAMDFDLWVRLLDAGFTFAHVPSTLATFEIHEDSKTGQGSLSRFLHEEARALYKSGRTRLASLALGRMAAHSALEDGFINAGRLKTAVADVIANGDPSWKIHAEVVMAGTKTEAAMLEMKKSLKGLRHLMAVEPWRVRETRARIFSAISAKAPPRH